MVKCLDNSSKNCLNLYKHIFLRIIENQKQFSKFIQYSHNESGLINSAVAIKQCVGIYKNSQTFYDTLKILIYVLMSY